MASGSRTTCARACSSRISRPNGTARVWGSLWCARRSRPTTGASPWRRRRAAAPRSPSSCPPREPARPARRRRDEHPQDGRGPARVGGVRDGGGGERHRRAGGGGARRARRRVAGPDDAGRARWPRDARAAQAGGARPAGGDDERQSEPRRRGAGHQAGRLSVPRKAAHAGGPAHDAAGRARAVAHARREPAPARSPGPCRPAGGREHGDGGAASADRAGRPHRGAGADHGRMGDREGARRLRHPSPERPRDEALRMREQRGHPEGPGRIGDVRQRARRVHRRHGAARGRFELADRGTLFLDEVGDLGPEAQAKLLRVLESGVIERLGGEKPLAVDVRVIAATNKHLAKASQQGQFREDLLFRLNVLPIHIPPLRERPDDIPPLVHHFSMRQATRLGRPVRFDAGAVHLLAAYPWPGNVRELANIMERLAILVAGEAVTADDVARVVRQDGTGDVTRSRAAAASDDWTDIALTEALDGFERTLIARALSAARGNVADAARKLATDRANLYRRMRRLGLEPPRNVAG